MIVEQIEAFKSWLTAVLKPMCEADPAALAKYVLALIKKDKSEEELRKTMVGQLDVFLEGETESFVNLVFQTLTSKDYITTPVIPNANPPNPNVVKPTKDMVKENKVIVSPSDLPSLSEAINGNSVGGNISNSTVPTTNVVPAAVATTAVVTPAVPLPPIIARKEYEPKRGEREFRKNSETEKDEKPRRRSRHRSLSRNRTRSRSRSWDRSKRSRSRDKSRDRDQHRIDREKRDRPRAWRNKSPPRRYDRRRSRTPSPSRLRSRSRSPRHSHRGRYRNRTSASRSRSRSLDKRDRKDSNKEKDVKDIHSRPGTPTQDSNHGDMDLRLTNSTQSIQSVVVQQNSKRRCRDFDEKGYCMRGEMCPFDHGVDPVVLEDSALTRVLSYNPNGTPADVPTGVMATPLINGPVHPMMGPRGIPPEYNPQAPQMWNRVGFRGPRPLGPASRVQPIGNFQPQPNIQRELIPVPVMDNKQQPDNYVFNQQQSNFINNMDHDNAFKKKSFDFNRLGPRSKNTSNCSLELKKVPQGLNSITHLNNHFSKFGKIVNIQVQYEGDPEAAIVTFSSHAEANAAYRSTEAVLNNRFIKVFWHSGNTENKQENVPPVRSVKDRLKTDNHVNTVNKEESKAQATAAIKKNQELLAAKEKLKKNQDEQRKEVLKIQCDLRKRKQELLEKQLSQQRILIEKMEKLPQGAQRDLVKDTIKKTIESIEEIKKDLEQTTAQAVKSAVPQKKTKEEAQREMLDAELDLITKQQEGADTSEIQKKLFELKAKAATVVRGTRGGRIRRYNPMVNRHLLSKNNLIDNSRVKNNLKKTVNNQTFHKHAVDHRPTRILVSGYETDEQDSVLSHFQQYGEVVDYTIDATLPSIVLNYKSRKEAEMALLKGKHFQDRTLSITWCNNLQINNQRSGRSSTRTVLMSESEEDQLMIDQSLLEGEEDLGPEISEEVLLQDDEEEDEENEDRSWRR